MDIKPEDQPLNMQKDKEDEDNDDDDVADREINMNDTSIMINSASH